MPHSFFVLSLSSSSPPVCLLRRINELKNWPYVSVDLLLPELSTSFYGISSVLSNK